MVSNSGGCWKIVPGWFVDNICNEKVTNPAISQNKAASKKHVESFKEGCDVVALKKSRGRIRREKSKAVAHNQAKVLHQIDMSPCSQLLWCLDT